jgi:hypothetical protein
MKLSENELSIAWLRQFPAQDVHLARLLLDSLKLVSFSEYELAVTKNIQAICSSTSGSIAIFAAEKRRIDPSATTPGSEDRLAHLLKNLERLNPGRILIKPTTENMRTDKVKHVILVDDFICSGQRMDDFWDVLTSSPKVDARSTKDGVPITSKKRGTLRSWLSFGYCQLWLAGYAIHEVGLKRLLKAIPYLNKEATKFTLTLKGDASYWPETVTDFLNRVERENTTGRHSFGWGNLLIPLVFQYGCPDNCPELLWKNSLRFTALFPNRAIPGELYPCFDGHDDSGRGPALLLEGGQSRLALSLLDDMAEGIRDSRYVALLTLLGLVLSGYAVRNIPGIMLRGEEDVRQLVATAREMALLDDQSKITSFGRDIVARSRGSFLRAFPKRQTPLEPSTFYLPMQFQKRLCGAQRKTRNEPDANS